MRGANFIRGSIQQPHAAFAVQRAMQFNSRLLIPLAVVAMPVISCRAADASPSKSVAKTATKSATATAATAAVRTAVPQLANWNFKLDEDELESAWTWTAPLEARGAFETRIAFHFIDAKNYLLLRVTGEKTASRAASASNNAASNNAAAGRVSLRFWRVVNGRIEKLGDPEATIDAFKLVAGDASTNAKDASAKDANANALPNRFGGQLTIQRSAWRVRALWNGRVVATAYNDFKGGQFGVATQGAARLGAMRMQPVGEVPFLRDDFMRAQGPDDPEIPGQWHRVAGVWKTSGLLGPRADAALNPNPFVFRAALSAHDAAKFDAAKSDAAKSSLLSTGVSARHAAIEGAPVVATVGPWFWSDYSVSAALRPALQNVDAPLVAGVSAFRPSANMNGTNASGASATAAGVDGLIDFREGRARILVNGRVVATSAPFDADPDQWHRVFLDPGPGTLRLVVDGVERVRVDASHMSTHAASAPAQGEAALVASLGGANYVDFDDVRIGPNDAVSDNFAVASIGRWNDVAGEWQTRPSGSGAVSGGRSKVSAGRAITLTGSMEREEGLVEVDFGLITSQEPRSVSVGVVFAARDASNFFLARRRAGRLEIVEFAKGQGKILAAAEPVWAPNKTYFNGEPVGVPQSIAVEWREGVITARSLGKTITATVSAVPAGRVGVWADAPAGMGVFTSFRALGAAPGWGEDVLPERFTKDRLMKNWASNASLWLGNQPTRWHTGDFFSDASLSLPLALTASNQGLKLMLAASPDAPDAGARLQIERAGDTVSFALFENGKAVGQASLPAASATGNLRFVRRPISAESVNLRVALGAKVLISSAASSGAASSGTASSGTAKIVETGLKTAFAPGMSTHVAGVKVGVDASRAPDFDWEKATASTSGVMDYAFTGAPVDWRAGKGRWEVKERWTCSPQWGFFAGDASVNPTLWSRFATRGDWTLEAYIATPMDVTRGERGPSDLNISVGADGRDLASGYSFLFSADKNRFNRVMRGDAIALEKPLGTLPPGDGSTHQDWFYIRLERRQTPQGLRFRYLVNGQEIWNYTDPSPLPDTRSGARQLAFWTQNGGLSIARVRLWHSGIEAGDNASDAPQIAAPQIAAPQIASATQAKNGTARIEAIQNVSSQSPVVLKNALGEWRGRSDGAPLSNLRVMKDGGRDALRVVNPQSGGDWTLFATQSGFDARDKPVLKFDYRVPESVFVNLYARVDKQWREITFAGDAARLDARLRNGNERDFARNPLSSGVPTLGGIDGVQADDKWHSTTFDLLEALRKAGLSTHVEALAFAAPDISYLRAGLGGNHKGATYFLSNFNASQNATNTPAASASKSDVTPVESAARVGLRAQ